MITIDLVQEAGEWESIAELQPLIEPAIHLTIEMPGLTLPEHSEIAIIFANDTRVRELNKMWRQQDKSTNVLSFPGNSGNDLKIPLLGDIVLAQETIQREADEQEKSFDGHLVHLCIHGFLHLVGYDHIEDADAVEMERLETDILATLGISDPYASIVG